MASSGAVFDHSNDEAIMPKANESFQLAATAEQIAKQTQEVMENYFGWLQKTVSALPWSNTNLNRILLSHATQNVTATFAFVQKLSRCSATKILHSRSDGSHDGACGIAAP